MIEIREVRNDTWTTETDPITTRNEPNGAIENTLRDPRKQGPAGRWTWERWSQRAQTDTQTLALTIHVGVWATIGALSGVGAFGFPGLFIDGYQFAIWQPIGAALGGALGAVGAWRAWRLMAPLHKNIS